MQFAYTARSTYDQNNFNRLNTLRELRSEAGNGWRRYADLDRVLRCLRNQLIDLDNDWIHSDEAGILIYDDAQQMLERRAHDSEFNQAHDAQHRGPSPGVAFDQVVDRNPDDGYDPGYVATYVEDVLCFLQSQR